jgi:hypothetical protein
VKFYLSSGWPLETPIHDFFGTMLELELGCRKFIGFIQQVRLNDSAVEFEEQIPFQTGVPISRSLPQTHLLTSPQRLSL